MEHVLFAGIVEEDDPGGDGIDDHEEAGDESPAPTAADSPHEGGLADKGRQYEGEHEADYEDTTTEGDVKHRCPDRPFLNRVRILAMFKSLCIGAVVCIREEGHWVSADDPPDVAGVAHA